MSSAAGESSENTHSLYDKHAAALTQFDRNLDALTYPVSRTYLIAATKRLLADMFDYTDKEASTRVEILDEQHDMPTEHELDDEGEVAAKMLKVGLFDKLPEEYIISYGEEGFDEWAELFLESVLRGHTEDSPSYGHSEECSDQRFCPAIILGRMVSDQLIEYATPLAQNFGYLPYSRELVHMNVTIIKLLHKFDVFDEGDTNCLLEEYRDWIDSSGVPLDYDETLFE